MSNELKKTSQLKGALAVELKTIKLMTVIYCKAHHQDSVCNDGVCNDSVCDDCAAFIKHAEQKLDRCVYGELKPACKACPIHCYKPEQKEQARLIMRYSGPKMLFKHPILAIKHLIKANKSFPTKIPVGLSNYHQRKKLNEHQRK